MGSGEFHDVDRRLREYIEAVDPGSRTVMNRMKMLCSLSCNAAAACMVFVAVDALAGNASRWTPAQIGMGTAATLGKA
jgi:hypothetical protein